MYRKKWPTIIAVWILLGSVVKAQSPYFQNYLLLRKSEQTQVQSLFQGRGGYLWIGTDKGLFQFDGVTTRQFTAKDKLVENSVTALAQDSLGGIWIGHPSGKISIRYRGQFTSFEPPEGTAAGEISDILFDRQGRLWFSTFNDGLYYFTHDRLYRLDQEDGMPDIFIYDLELDAQGNVVAATDGGIAICTLVDRKASIKTIGYAEGLPDNIVKKIVLAKDGTLWLATEDAGVVHINTATKSVETLDPQWSYGAIQDLVALGDQLWIANTHGELIIYEGRKQIANYQTALSSITTLLCDQEGNIWVGSKMGLSRTLGNIVEYIDRFDPFMNANVGAVTVDSTGTLWFSTPEGLFTRTKERGVERVLLPPAFQNSSVISLYTDSEGFVWAGTYGEGALRIHPQTRQVTALQSELTNGSVLNISGRGEHVWLSTLGGGTRITLGGKTLTVQNFTTRDGLASDYVYQIFPDSKGRVWFATDRAGIDRLTAGAFKHYKDAFASKAVYSIAEDGDHRIWANVQGDGLVLVDGEPLSGLPTNWKELVGTPISLATDREGNLVIVNDRGIVQLDVKSRTIRLLGDEIGFREQVANMNSITRDTAGKIWIGTEDGIVVYNGATSDGVTQPVPRITGLRAFDEEIEIRDDVQLRYDQNNLTFQITGFWFQNPQGVSFEYQLENYDREWIATGDRLIVYSSLPPGEYVFKVRASNQQVFASSAVATLAISIRPPFWRTTVFYISVTVVLALLGYTFVKNRESRLRREKEVLERRVHQRTQEIQKKNEEIQAQSEEIRSINDNLERMVQVRTAELEKKNKALEEYAFINAHNLRAPVASILGLINLLSKLELDETGSEVVTHLEQSAERLDSVVKSITEAIERGETPLPYRHVNEDEVD